MGLGVGTEGEMVLSGVLGHSIEIALETIEVHHGNRRLVHHIMIYSLNTGRKHCRLSPSLYRVSPRTSGQIRESDPK